jgi:SAM-dependent methyltransferase
VTIETPADLDAVRASYDAVADNYVNMVGDPGPWLRAALDAFAEQVRDVGPVLDAGCGPGWITHHLHRQGVDVSGVDLSPRMVDHARRRFPGITFEVASVTDLRPAPASLGGVLGWWSWFNLPREWLPTVIRRMALALRPDGQLVIGLHRGEGDHARTTCYGDVPVSWTTHRYEPEVVIDMLHAAELEVVVEQRFPPKPPSGAPSFLLVGAKPAP